MGLTQDKALFTIVLTGTNTFVVRPPTRLGGPTGSGLNKRPMPHVHPFPCMHRAWMHDACMGRDARAALRIGSCPCGWRPGCEGVCANGKQARPLHGHGHDQGGGFGTHTGSALLAVPPPPAPPAPAPAAAAAAAPLQTNLVKQISKLVKVRYVEDITKTDRIGAHRRARAWCGAVGQMRGKRETSALGSRQVVRVGGASCAALT